MELREYLRVILRYWWLTVALVVVVGVGSWIYRPHATPDQHHGGHSASKDFRGPGGVGSFAGIHAESHWHGDGDNGVEEIGRNG